MRHHSQHIARLVEDAGNVAARSVAILDIAEGDTAFALDPVQRLVVGEEIAVVMGNRDADFLPCGIAAGEDRLRVLHFEAHVAADEILAGVAHQRTGQQARLGKDLEAVAHAQNRHAAVGGADDFAHDRAVGCHRARTQVIAIGETTGQGDEVEPTRQFGIAMPDAHRRGAGNLLQRHRHVAVAIGAREGDDGGAETHQPSFSMR